MRATPSTSRSRARWRTRPGSSAASKRWRRSPSELALVATSGLRCVMLGGEAGIGKTTLLAAFAEQLVSSASATVVYGRCDETGVSLQPFRSVLAACVEHAPGAHRDRTRRAIRR